MQAGALRHRVELQDYTETQDSAGDVVKDYVTSATVHAQIVTSGGRELYAAQQVFAEANAIIKMRYRDGVSERMRVYHPAEATYYDILNARRDDKSRRAVLILTCRSGLSDEA